MILYYMQDETAGMFIFSSPQDVKPGDKVKITGKLLTYKNELEIELVEIQILHLVINFQKRN